MLDLLKICVRMTRVEDLVTVHYRHEVLRLRKVDDVVRISWQHVDTLDIVTAHLELYHIVSTNLALLNQSVVLCQCCPFVMPGFEILMLT